ncbi:cytochrome b [Chthonobacter albigriseus]|uniref:cytochrome b n=1 Tax=Chthonobacter albigriseus TaxID=1683161 RepID=UPI0015EE68EA|nr:cytochrome b/b6 domain-containing protein [Chthonobacter albigriseus]
MQTATRTGYSLTQIVLHWAIAALVLFQLVFGESMAEAVEAAEEGEALSAVDQTMASAHYWVGIAILALVAVRLLVRIRTGAPDAIGEGLSTKIAAGLHHLFYLLLVLVPVTGLMGFYLGDPWGEIHEVSKPVFIVLIAIHAGAALFHAVVLRDETLKRMLRPGRG